VRREAALRGVPAIAFSCGPKGSLEHAAKVAVEIVRRVLAAGTPPGGTPLLNVNFPAGAAVHHGIRATRLGRRSYDDEVVTRRDPRGHEYVWLGGPNAHHHPEEGTDTEAVDAGYVSVTPLRLDMVYPEHLGLAAFVAGVGELVPEG
jgi:5'-nucleotidase